MMKFEIFESEEKMIFFATLRPIFLNQIIMLQIYFGSYVEYAICSFSFRQFFVIKRVGNRPKMAEKRASSRCLFLETAVSAKEMTRV